MSSGLRSASRSPLLCHNVWTKIDWSPSATELRRQIELKLPTPRRRTPDPHGAMGENMGVFPVCRKVFHSKDMENVLGSVGSHSSQLTKASKPVLRKCYQEPKKFFHMGLCFFAAAFGFFTFVGGYNRYIQTNEGFVNLEQWNWQNRMRKMMVLLLQLMLFIGIYLQSYPYLLHFLRKTDNQTLCSGFFFKFGNGVAS